MYFVIIEYFNSYKQADFSNSFWIHQTMFANWKQFFTIQEGYIAV